MPALNNHYLSRHFSFTVDYALTHSLCFSRPQPPMKNEGGPLSNSNAPKRPKDLIGAKIGESTLRARADRSHALCLSFSLSFINMLQSHHH